MRRCKADEEGEALLVEPAEQLAVQVGVHGAAEAVVEAVAVQAQVFGVMTMATMMTKGTTMMAMIMAHKAEADAREQRTGQEVRGAQEEQGGQEGRRQRGAGLGVEVVMRKKTTRRPRQRDGGRLRQVTPAGPCPVLD